MHDNLKALSAADFAVSAADANTIVVDSRPATDFCQSFVPRSVFLGTKEHLPEVLLAFVPADSNILLVATKGTESEIADAIKAAGFSNIIGYLANEMDAWKNAGLQVDMIIDIEPDEFAMDLPHDPNLMAIDLRSADAFHQSHVANSVSLPLADLADLALIAALPEEANIYLISENDSLAVVGASLIKRQGLHNIRIVTGGIVHIEQQTKVAFEKNKAQLN